MRKILLSILLCFACLATLHAERPRPFEVKRLRSWAPEYLTITNVYRVENVKLYNLENCPVREDYLWSNLIETNHEKLWIKIGTVIRSIDGQDTKNMSEQTFYNILAQKDEHEMYVYDPYIGGYESPYDLRIKFTIKEPPMWMQQCLPYSQDEILSGENIPGLAIKELQIEKTQQEDLQEIKKKVKVSVDSYWDKDFDWFSIQTYDFIPTQDPLVDKELMEKFVEQFPRLKRDSNNPDVLIRLTKDEQQSVNSTYVPPTIQVVNEGSTIRKTYNYYGNDTYKTEQKNRVIKEGDYVQTTSTEDLYLEIVMLDADRIEQTIPPIIYQLKYKRHIVNNKNQPFDAKEDYLPAISGWVQDPFDIDEATEYRITSYTSVPNKKYHKRAKYDGYWTDSWSYFTVTPTNLANLNVLGKSIFSEGDVIEEKTERGRSSCCHYYYIVEHNGKKIKKRNKQLYTHFCEDDAWDFELKELHRSACVTFYIWRFAIDEE